MNIINCLTLIDEKGNILGYFKEFNQENKPIITQNIKEIKRFDNVDKTFEYLHQNQTKLKHFVVNGIFLTKE